MESRRLKRPVRIWIAMFFLVAYASLHVLAAYRNFYAAETTESTTPDETRAFYVSVLVGLTMFAAFVGVLLRHNWARWLSIVACIGVFIYYLVTAIKNTIGGDRPADAPEAVVRITAFLVVFGPLPVISFVFALSSRVRNYFSLNDEDAKYLPEPPPPPTFES
jgi:hypothetical protein